jgi:hypothetical protein
VALAITVGCNSSGVSLGTVTGRITKNGKPQSNVSVYLTPSEGRPSEGLTNENGEYQMVYTRDIMGALVGKQRLTVGPPSKELVSKDVEITSGNNRFDFDLAELANQKAK